MADLAQNFPVKGQSHKGAGTYRQADIVLPAVMHSVDSQDLRNVRCWACSSDGMCDSQRALDRSQPGLPIKPGRCQTMPHGYQPRDTTTLLAALSALDARVIGRCM